MNETPIGVKLAGVFLGLSLAFTSGVEYAHAHSHANPRPCHVRADVLPSGDASVSNGHEVVCTDGTLVKITGYGR